MCTPRGMHAMRDGTSPTVRRRRVGTEMRRLRESAGVTTDEAARCLECSASKISRIETGRVAPRQRDVRDLLTLYRVADSAAVGRLLDLVAQSREQGWWQPYSDVVPEWLETYVGLEGDAAVIHTYESVLVPGVLQTEDYTRALIRSSDRDASYSEVERMVALRLERRKRFEQADRPELWVVLDEAVLHRPVGGPVILRDQLEYLLTAAARERLTVQVMPFEVGGYPAQGFPFTIFSFPESVDTPVVYVEELAGALYLEKIPEVQRYKVAFDYMRARALDPADGTVLISRILKTLE
jgi:transcriptional regulator with XRE-family HTH domain